MVKNKVNTHMITAVLGQSRKRALRYIHNHKDIVRYMGPDCGMAIRWGYAALLARKDYVRLKKIAWEVYAR